MEISIIIRTDFLLTVLLRCAYSAGKVNSLFHIVNTFKFIDSLLAHAEEAIYIKNTV